MCGGGGGGHTVPQVDPFAEARAQIEVLREEERIRLKREVAQRERELADRAQKEQLFNTNLGSAYNSALQYGQQRFGELGLGEDIFNKYQAELDRVKASVPFLADNPGTYFSESIVDSVLGRERDSTRRNYVNQLNQFANDGFAKNLWADTADDALIDSILSAQYQDASDSILRAYERGNLNDAGYQYALKNLDQQRTAAYSRLQDLGGSVLGDFRTGLNDIAEQARSKANAWDFGMSFDPTTYKSQIDSTYNDQKSKLEGRLRGALGGEQLFNIDDMIQRAGINQGMVNPAQQVNGGSLLEAIAQKQQNEEKKRGLGEQGAF